MTFDEAIEQSVSEGAIRQYRVSDNLAYVYRFYDGQYQARGIYATEGQWALGKRLVASVDYSQQSGWHTVVGLPWQAQAIESEPAKLNPGYGFAIFRQCYTCKEEKSINRFSHQGGQINRRREWECNECYERRMREVRAFNRKSPLRSGDAVEKETIASAAPPISQI